MALSRDDRYAFVTRESADDLAVFDLDRALHGGFGPKDYVGSVPLGVAPVGLAVASSGHWVYVTSQARTPQVSVGPGASRRVRPRPGNGIMSVIDVRRAESKPAAAVVSTVRAGSTPTRVAVSSNGSTVWVTARGSDTLLAFSAAKLLSDPHHARVAQVSVGPAPVGLVLIDHARVVVANSNRFSGSGSCGSLSVIDASAALAGRPATLGVIAAGQFPRQLAFEPGRHELLVTNYASAQLEAVDLATVP